MLIWKFKDSSIGDSTGTVNEPHSITSWYLRFRGKLHRFSAVQYIDGKTRVRVWNDWFTYRTTLRELPVPNHISPTSPWSRKLASSCPYLFSQLQEAQTSKWQVMHNGYHAVKVCTITYKLKVPRFDGVSSSLSCSFILFITMLLTLC